MKRKILAFLTAACLMLGLGSMIPEEALSGLGLMSASAALKSGKCGENLTYEFDNSTGTLTISGSGKMYNYEMFDSPFYNKNSIKKVSIQNGVTSIGNWAFYYCEGLTDVNIPDSVSSIGNTAFYRCTKLPGITIPDSVTSIGENAFHDCESLTSITIPDSVTSIAQGAFSHCTSLTSIKIPDSVRSIGQVAFYYCTSLTSIKIPDSVTNIGSGAFTHCTSLTSIKIPDGVTSIGDSTFSECTSLASIIIPDSVTSIGRYAFYECPELKSAAIPDGVTSIGDSTFYNCKSLTSIIIPDGVTSIGKNAFYLCTSLTSISVPDSVTSFGEHAFTGCSSLTSINIPEGVTSTGMGPFNGCKSLTSIIIPEGVTSIGERAFNNCKSLTNITIPDSVTSIGNWAFESCESLASISIPDSVTSIGKNAFEHCKNLTSINIPNGVTSISSDTFFDCDSLTSISVPNSVTSIGDLAFYYCTNLTSIIISDGVTSIGRYAFYSCEKCTSITIPKSVTEIKEKALGYHYDKYWGTVKLDGFKIYCYKDTAGEKYAKDNGFSYELLYEGPLYTVTFSSNGGTGSIASKTLEEGSSYTLPACTFTPPEGQEFSKWEVGGKYYAPGESFTVTADTSVKAIWKYLTFTVTFTKGGGSGTMSSQTVRWGSSYVLPACGFTAPSQKIFDKWKIGGTYYKAGQSVTVKADISAAAVWKNKYVNIIIESDNGTEEFEGKTLNNGESFTLPSCSFTPPKGKGFYKWSIDGTEYDPGQTITPEADIIITAVWKEGIAATCTVTIIANNGTIVRAGTSVKKGDTYTLLKCPFSAPEGMRFDKWSIDGKLYNVGQTITVNSDIEIIAMWKEITFVPGDADGDGTVNMQDYALFQRFLAGWSVDIDEEACDLNEDGDVNMLDYALMQRMLAGWETGLPT